MFVFTEEWSDAEQIDVPSDYAPVAQLPVQVGEQYVVRLFAVNDVGKSPSSQHKAFALLNNGTVAPNSMLADSMNVSHRILHYLSCVLFAIIGTVMNYLIGDGGTRVGADGSLLRALLPWLVTALVAIVVLVAVVVIIVIFVNRRTSRIPTRMFLKIFQVPGFMRVLRTHYTFW